MTQEPAKQILNFAAAYNRWYESRTYMSAEHAISLCLVTLALMETGCFPIGNTQIYGLVEAFDRIHKLVSTMDEDSHAHRALIAARRELALVCATDIVAMVEGA